MRQELRRRLTAALSGTGGQGAQIMAIRVAGAGLGLAAQVLAARLVGPEAFGYFALALVWLLLLGHGATAGTNQLVCRYLSAYVARGDVAHAAGLLRFALCMAGGFALAIALGAVLLVRAGPFDLDPRFVALASFTFAFVPLIVLQDFLEAIARGLDRPTLGIAPAILLRHLAVIAGVSALIAAGSGADALTVMAMTVAGLVASVVIQFALLYPRVRARLAGARPAYRTRTWFLTALPIALVDLCEVLLNNADIIVLGLFMPPEIVAFYFAATRLVQVLAYVPYGISAVTAQKYAALAASMRHGELQAMIGKVTLAATALSAIGALALSLVAAPLLGLFGEGYDAAAGVVPLLGLAIVALCAFGPGEDVLTMLGEERACSAIFVLAVATSIGLGLLLVPAWGMHGAAAAVLASAILRGAALAWVARQRLGLALPLASRAPATPGIGVK
jgi:O-antigen/teichoic acid export membrane protein